MTDTNQFIVKHGAPIVFGAVLVEQMGLPLPALPWLLGAGALAATGKFNLAAGLLLTMIACLIADAVWFYLGRARGNQVLNLLCRISLEPDSCVRRTQNVFTRYGWKGIVVAKFLPGLSTVVPPLAGMSKLNAGKFFLLDGLGSLLYGGSLLALGFYFSNEIEKIAAAIASVGGSAFVVIGSAAAIYVGFKYWQRRRVLNELRMARITVDDLHQMRGTKKDVVILDLRSDAEYHRDPFIIEGAVHLSVDDIKQRRYQFSTEREVVVYCSCPNEVTAARVALLLKRHGFRHVRPLLGGLDAWRDQNYPVGKAMIAEAKEEIEKGRLPD